MATYPDKDRRESKATHSNAFIPWQPHVSILSYEDLNEGMRLKNERTMNQMAAQQRMVWMQVTDMHAAFISTQAIHKMMKGN